MAPSRRLRTQERAAGFVKTTVTHSSLGALAILIARLQQSLPPPGLAGFKVSSRAPGAAHTPSGRGSANEAVVAERPSASADAIRVCALAVLYSTLLTAPESGVWARDSGFGIRDWACRLRLPNVHSADTDTFARVVPSLQALLEASSRSTQQAAALSASPLTSLRVMTDAIPWDIGYLHEPRERVEKLVTMGEVLKTSKGKQEMWRGLRGTVFPREGDRAGRRPLAGIHSGYKRLSGGLLGVSVSAIIGYTLFVAEHSLLQYK
ncbi:hypothetical protein OH76DRAFT_1419382 [Lentinus brumalis]|uniref:Uncharacterized protein n=1 Tax=Lentinus brumalis TaxID=2498619 RepID=A0A371D5A7_9APHY|nr:hypothetical protein OH76DRAFT_1419382 [Polyporus brumalis]